jgi:hypothetical protein
MRKSILIALIITIGITKIAAQSQTRFSVFANPSINWLSSDVKTILSNKAAFGYDIGLTIDKFFAEKYAFSTGISIGSYGGELNYKGISKFSTSDGDTSLVAGTNVNYNLQYIHVPLGLRFKSVEIGYFTIYANLGLNNSFNIKASATSNDTKKVLESSNVKNMISLYNLGYFIGGGTEYSLGGGTALIFGVNYNVGFVDITGSDYDNAVITSSSIAFRLGLLF